MADGKRFVLEGRLISIALQVLRLGTSAVLDFGLWGRDERSALRWLTRSAGTSCRVAYLPVDKDVQLARIVHRQADVDAWREQFQVPDAAELDGSEIPGPPAGWPGWPEWASEHWPSLGRRLGPGSNTDRDLPRHRTVAGCSNPSTQGHIRQSSAHMPSCSA